MEINKGKLISEISFKTVLPVPEMFIWTNSEDLGIAVCFKL